MTSNNGGHVNNQGGSTVENRALQMPPIFVSARIGDIYTI